MNPGVYKKIDDHLQKRHVGRVQKLSERYLTEIHDRLVESAAFDFRELFADPFLWTNAPVRAGCRHVRWGLLAAARAR